MARDVTLSEACPELVEGPKGLNLSEWRDLSTTLEMTYFLKSVCRRCLLSFNPDVLLRADFLEP